MMHWSNKLSSTTVLLEESGHVEKGIISLRVQICINYWGIGPKNAITNEPIAKRLYMYQSMMCISQWKQFNIMWRSRVCRKSAYLKIYSCGILHIVNLPTFECMHCLLASLMESTETALNIWQTPSPWQ